MTSEITLLFTYIALENQGGENIVHDEDDHVVCHPITMFCDICVLFSIAVDEE